MRINERSWSGQIISWIKEAVNNGTTLFEDATNDEGIKMESGKTKFPDILLNAYPLIYPKIVFKMLP